MRDWYVARAAQVIQPRVERHAARLGISHAKTRIVDNRYRWGSYTVKDNVNFNWRLIKAPVFVIDYVIVHACPLDRAQSHSGVLGIVQAQLANADEEITKPKPNKQPKRIEKRPAARVTPATKHPLRQTGVVENRRQIAESYFHIPTAPMTTIPR